MFLKIGVPKIFLVLENLENIREYDPTTHALWCPLVLFGEWTPHGLCMDSAWTRPGNVEVL